MKYTPEAGYPAINLSQAQQFDPEAIFTYDDGSTETGADLNDRLEHYLTQTPRGQQLRAYLNGEGPVPEPLFTLIGDNTDGQVFLGAVGPDVTELEPLAETMISELLPPPGEMQG